MTRLTRRTFCVGALAAAGRGALSAASSILPTRSRQARGSKPPRGVQAGILRELLTRDLERTLERVAAIGYSMLELQWYGGNFGRTPRELRRACEAVSLRIPSALIRAGSIQVGWERHLAAAHEIGLEYLTVVNLSEDEAQSIEDWREWADVFNRAGERARRAGIWLALHNEPPFMTAMNGRVPYDEFLARTDASLVALSMDAANMVRAEADPLAYLRAHQQRYRLGHLKDVTHEGAVGGGFGSGRVPLRDVLASLSAEARQRQFIEHPLNASSPFEDLAAIHRAVSAAYADVSATVGAQHAVP